MVTLVNPNDVLRDTVQGIRRSRKTARATQTAERDPRGDSGGWTLTDEQRRTCAACGMRIVRKRLRAVPRAQRCFECQLALERCRRS